MTPLSSPPLVSRLCLVIAYAIVTDDGKRPSLTCVTSGGKILVYCPYSDNEPACPKDAVIGPTAVTGTRQDDGSMRFLNMNQKVTTNFSQPASIVEGIGPPGTERIPPHPENGFTYSRKRYSNWGFNPRSSIPWSHSCPGYDPGCW